MYESDLATGLEDLKQRVANEVEDPGIRKRVIESLTRASNSVSNVIERGQLKVGKGEKTKISESNIVVGKRKRKQDESTDESLKLAKEHGVKKRKTYDKIKFQPGDAVSVPSKTEITLEVIRRIIRKGRKER